MSKEGSSSDLGSMEPSSAWTRFWFTPIPTTGLRVLRVLSGLLFCAWLLSFLGHQAEFFSLDGWFDRIAYERVQAQPELSPGPIGWSILYLAGEDRIAFQAIYWASLAVVVLFTLGVATRVTGVVTWVVVVSFLANPATSYEGDYLLGILAFYLMIASLLSGQWNGGLTPLERILGCRHDFVLAPWLLARTNDEQTLSVSANFAIRLLQLHFAVIILTSVLHKLQIAEWWSGIAFWFPLHPPFKTTEESIRRELPSANWTLIYLSLTQYIVLAWQLSFPIFAWRKGLVWRTLLLGGAAVNWLGVYFLFGLPLFGPFVLIACLSYLKPEEWARITEPFASRFRRPEEPAEPAESKKLPTIVAKDAIKRVG